MTLNYLTITGDVDTIGRIVETHFKIEPPDESPNVRERICNFPGLIEHPTEFNFGFRMAMRSTAKDANSSPPGPWDGTITNPFFIFWYSRRGASVHVPLTLLSLYPSVELEYSWLYPDDDYPVGIGQRCKSENGYLIIVDELEMVNETEPASKLTWENGRVFVPPEVECTWRRNDRGTRCGPEKYSGFWIYQDDLKYTHPDEIGENFMAELSKDSFHDEGKWSVYRFDSDEYSIATENMLLAELETAEAGDILSKLRSRTARLSYEASLVNTEANGDAIV